MSRQNENINIVDYNGLTPKQIAEAHRRFYSLACNLERIKQEPQADEEIQSLADAEDHEMFRSMYLVAGFDVDEFCKGGHPDNTNDDDVKENGIN